MAQPALGDRIRRRQSGAEPGHVVLGDTLSVKIVSGAGAAIVWFCRKVIPMTDQRQFSIEYLYG
jgi:kynureninase